MKNINRLLLIIIILSVFNTEVISQYSSLRVEVRMDNNTRVDEEAQPFLDQIISNCHRIMGQYADLATFIDPEEDVVTTKSIEDFRALFQNSNARIFNDLVSYGRNINLEQYINLVVQNMNKTGPKFKINDLLVKNIVRNRSSSSLNFEITIQVNKLMLNQINDKTYKTEEIAKGGELFQLEFVILNQGTELSEISIYEILGKEKSKPQKYNQEVTASISSGFDVNSQFKVHEGFDQRFVLNIRSQTMLDVGVRYSRSFKRGGHTKWIVGLTYGLHNWSINTENSNAFFRAATDPPIPNIELTFNDAYELRNVDNIIDFSFVQSVIGFQTPLKRIAGYRMEYWLNAAVLPTFIRKNESIGNNRSTILNSELNFRGSREIFCNDEVNVRTTGLEQTGKASTFGLQLMPSIKYYLNNSKTTAATLGAGYLYYLGTWIDPNSASVYESIAIDTPRTLILNSITPAHIRLEAGVSIKLN